MADPDESEGSGGVDRARQIARLRRIEGQVRGVQQMIGSGRDYVEVSQQTDAVIAALRRVRSDMLRDHVQGLVQGASAGDLPEAERRRLADELGRLVARMT